MIDLDRPAGHRRLARSDAQRTNGVDGHSEALRIAFS
jgi:hypothetical protein